MKPKIIITALGSLLVSALISHAQESTNAAATPAEATPAVAAATPAEPAPAAAAAAPAETAPAATAAAPQGSAIIPLIVIDDTPLLDAIRNLARQAGINLIVDPKVSFGQPGADGKPIPQPSVSIRWENISAEQALGALLGNYGLQAVEDPKIHITRITVKDPAAPEPLITRTIQLKFAGPTNVLASVNATLTDKRSKVVADVRTSQLVVVATEREVLAVEDLVGKLDGKPKQVLIEARLVETTANPTTVKGIDWSETLGNSAAGIGKGQRVTFGNNGGVLNNVTMNDLNGAFGFNPAAAFLNADGLKATISFLNANKDAKVLSVPRTVTLDNELAHIEAGTLYPIVNVTAGTANTTGGSQINYSNLTVRLDVTPRISANNFINLKVIPNIMRLDSVQKFTAGEGSFDVPIFATRNIESTVLIPSGNTLVMGGVISDAAQSGNLKVPILGDLPFMGRLFRQDSKTRNKQNLIVFVTPTIVEEQDFQPTKSDFLNHPVPLNDSTGPDWSSWDSGKPKDWSKEGGATK